MEVIYRYNMISGGNLWKFMGPVQFAIAIIAFFFTGI